MFDRAVCCRPVVPDSMPQQYATLMEHCWATAPEQRPTAEQLLEALEYLKQQLPADMAQAAGQQHQQQQQPDSMQRAQSMPPVLFGRTPHKQQQRLQAQRSFVAASAAADDVNEVGDDTLLPDDEQPGGQDQTAAAAASAGGSAADQLGRCRSEPAAPLWGEYSADEDSGGYQGLGNTVV